MDEATLTHLREWLASQFAEEIETKNGTVTRQQIEDAMVAKANGDPVLLEHGWWRVFDEALPGIFKPC